LSVYADLLSDSEEDINTEEDDEEAPQCDMATELKHWIAAIAQRAALEAQLDIFIEAHPAYMVEGRLTSEGNDAFMTEMGDGFTIEGDYIVMTDE